MTQFVSVRFRPHDTRTYTYANDGAPVRVGDRVKVPDNRGDGWKPVEVVAINQAEPPFPCKAIVGVVDGQAIDDKLLAGDKSGSFGDPLKDYVEDVRSGLAGPDLFGDDA